MNSISSADLHIPIQLLAHAKDMALPAYGSAEAAGLDLCAAIDQIVTLAPGGRALVPTGIAIALPKGYEGQVRPRSGLALKYGVTILNAPGTIDSDYRGEIGVILINLDSEPFQIQRGDRIAQLVIAPISRIQWKAVSTLEETKRGEGGFGSTGTGSQALQKSGT